MARAVTAFLVACVLVAACESLGIDDRVWLCESDGDCDADEGCVGGSCQATGEPTPAICTPACTEGRACVAGSCLAISCGDGRCDFGFGEDCFGCERDCGCDDGETCTFEGSCCAPDCDGRSCGDDGCGGSCGTCDAGATCDGEGQCVVEPCGDETCDDAGGETCRSCPADCACTAPATCSDPGRCVIGG